MTTGIKTAPKNQKPQDRRKSILGAFETLVEAERQGILDHQFVAQVIWEAHDYARKNKLPYDGTFRGAMKLAEGADRLVQDHAAIEEREQRQHMEERRRKAGYSGRMQVKEFLQ